MPTTPENPILIEHPETPIFSESLTTSTGVQPVPVNVTQVNDNKGNPIISTPATNSAKIQIPSDRTSLLQRAKGKIENAGTWLARFVLRSLAKQNANSNTTN